MSQPVTCPGCAKAISEEHDACPHCGSPAANTAAAARTFAPEDGAGPRPRGKEWKIVRLIGLLLMASGAVAWTAGSSDAGMVFFLGCLIVLGSLLGAWLTRGQTH